MPYITECSWDFFSRKVAWNCLAPCTTTHFPNYLGLDELKRVEQAVNCISMRGKKRLIGRRFPKSGSNMTVKIRTIRKRLGRALEMRNKLRLGRPFDEVSCLSFTNGGEGDLGGKRSGRLHSKLRP